MEHTENSRGLHGVAFLVFFEALYQSVASNRPTPDMERLFARLLDYARAHGTRVIVQDPGPPKEPFSRDVMASGVRATWEHIKLMAREREAARQSSPTKKK